MAVGLPAPWAWDSGEAPGYLRAAAHTLHVCMPCIGWPVWSLCWCDEGPWGREAVGTGWNIFRGCPKSQTCSSPPAFVPAVSWDVAGRCHWLPRCPQGHTVLPPWPSPGSPALRLREPWASPGRTACDGPHVDHDARLHHTLLAVFVWVAAPPAADVAELPPNLLLAVVSQLRSSDSPWQLLLLERLEPFVQPCQRRLRQRREISSGLVSKRHVGHHPEWLPPCAPSCRKCNGVGPVVDAPLPAVPASRGWKCTLNLHTLGSIYWFWELARPPVSLASRASSWQATWHPAPALLGGRPAWPLAAQILEPLVCFGGAAGPAPYLAPRHCSLLGELCLRPIQCPSLPACLQRQRLRHAFGRSCPVCPIRHSAAGRHLLREGSHGPQAPHHCRLTHCLQRAHLPCPPGVGPLPQTHLHPWPDCANTNCHKQATVIPCLGNNICR